MRLNQWMWGLGAAAMLVAAGAWADSAGDKVDRAGSKARGAFERAKEGLTGNEQTNLEVRVAAGVEGFTGDLDGVTSAGPMLGVQVGAQRWNLVGIELGYEGSRHAVANAFSEHPAIWRHNLAALAKVSPPMMEMIKPYVGAGLGLSYVNANNDAEGLYRNDFLQELPLVAGVDYRRGILDVGLRGQYRLLFNEEFAERVAPEAGGGMWGATLNVGGVF